jgi:hypothetical protein
MCIVLTSIDETHSNHEAVVQKVNKEISGKHEGFGAFLTV